jgi:hypothetical protein
MECNAGRLTAKAKKEQLTKQRAPCSESPILAGKLVAKGFALAPPSPQATEQQAQAAQRHQLALAAASAKIQPRPGYGREGSGESRQAADRGCL